MPILLASHDDREVCHKKMTAINEILLPILIFLAYFFIAIQFLPQPPTLTVFDPLKIVEEQSSSIVEIIHGKGSPNDLEAAVISRDWLETQSLANLKAIAAELCITPIGDKRLKPTWINAIASTTPENTVLAVNLCYA
jgi:hypothetical protein